VEGVDDAGNGGCVLNAGTLVLRGVTLQDCQAERGGAIHNRGILSIADSRIRMGTALEGGGVHNARDALLALSGSTIEDCFASHHGGGIDAVDSIVMVSRSTIRTSRANVSGGAIAMRWSPGVQPPSGLLRLEESVLQANWADMTGGGVYNDRQLVALIASTLAGNSSPGRGGGVYTTGQTAVVHALNATFSGNEAGNGGGALENDHVYPSQVELVQASLVDNRGWNAAVEGGFASRRSLLANTGANCFVPNGMTLDDAGGNFASDASCAGFNLASREAMALGPLADNGGPTPTHALLPGSVALDVEGDCTDLAGHPVGSDQRGFARPADGDGDGIARCDAGAYERTGDTVFADGFDG
jgi:hypothetical protein